MRERKRLREKRGKVHYMGKNGKRKGKKREKEKKEYNIKNNIDYF